MAVAKTAGILTRMLRLGQCCPRVWGWIEIAIPSYRPQIPLSVSDLRKTDAIPAPEFYLQLPFLASDLIF